jgi:pimeloyl-ACP methyl ester carboxylesterase
LNFVTSQDGTRIGYETIGHGTPLILIPGVLAYAHSLGGLAAELANNFTVHTMERRGRGASGPQGDNYSILKECEDLSAIQAGTGAQYAFGHSFGGFLLLEAARTNHMLKKIAVYEPGVSIDGSINMTWAARCEQEIYAGRNLDAFTTFVQGSVPQMGKIPHWLAKRILTIAVKKPGLEEKYPLLHGMILEHEEEVQLNNTYEHYAEITTRTLLMYSGAKSSVNANGVAEKLAFVIPNTTTILLPGLNHLAPEEKPENVAKELIVFFEPNPTSASRDLNS